MKIYPDKSCRYSHNVTTNTWSKICDLEKLRCVRTAPVTIFANESAVQSLPIALSSVRNVPYLQSITQVVHPSVVMLKVNARLNAMLQGFTFPQSLTHTANLFPFIL